VKTGLSLRDYSKQWALLSSLKWVLACGICSVLVTGCVAQQADVARIQKDLENQIAKIKEEKKSLGLQVDETKAQLLKMNEEAKKTRGNLASINQKATLLQEKDVASLYGKLEETEKSIKDLRKDFTNQTDLLNSEVQKQGEELQTANTHNTAIDQKVDALVQQVDENNQALTVNMNDFQGSLAQFKDTLTSLGATIGTVKTDLSAQQQELGTVKSRTEELAQSTHQVREALGKSGTELDSRLEEQSGHITQLQMQVTTLQDKLNADTQALQNYLEQDVKSAMAQLVNEVDRHQEPVLARMDSLQKDMEALGTHVQADAAQVQDLSQSVLKLREAQEVMGSLLGKRGDEIIQQAGRISERMNTVESHQTALAEQLQANTQKTSSHLAEVNSSLTSISRALEQTNQSLSSRLAKQEEAIHTYNQTLQQFQQLKLETQDQIQQMQSASKLTDQLRQSVEQISSRLQDLEIHQSGLVGKLDSDAQVTNTHLQEVNSGIKSIAQALENVSSKLNTRIDDQEQRLNRAMTSFQRVQNTADTSQTNLAHLNQLTETVNQLRAVVSTIGTKLGERVDQHEDRLGQLAQRVNRLQSPKQQK
jgi:chromosome segregation ATPase